MSKANYLIVGLGNIGEDYSQTRHNIGFDVVDMYGSQNKASWALDRHALISFVSIRGKKVALLKPTTFMNLSGKAYSYWLNQLNIPVEKSLIITDDMALPLGKLRLKAKGTHAGHNGLKDIMASLNSGTYPRLRFGIGNDFPKGRQVEFVLGKWGSDEVKLVEDAKIRATLMIDSWLHAGINTAMNTHN